MVSGLVGGLPTTSVIVRSSVNINSGAQTKLATIFHGCLLLASVVLLPAWLNMIPLSCLAAILTVTGAKLASPALVKRMWSEGYYQFVPFILTVIAIVLTDLLVGVLIGMAISIGFILRSNFRRPLRQFVEKQLGGEVLHLQLASQVSFLNRAAIEKALDSAPRGGHVLLDAQATDYIDPDVLNLIRTFEERTAKVRGVKVSLLGFRKKYHLRDRTRYVDYSTAEIQKSLTPEQVLQILKDGNERFRTGHRLTRNLSRQVHATAEGQAPLAVVLTCIDSRSPAELVFDLGVGDIFSVRIAGNVTSQKVLGSMEYSCAVAGAKLLLVMGHTRCGAVGAAVSLLGSGRPVAEATGCEHLEPIVQEIQQSVHVHTLIASSEIDPREREKLVNLVARDNVLRSVRTIREESRTLARLANEGSIAIIGAMYDVVTGTIEFLNDSPSNEQGATTEGETASKVGS
jgi:carbonic anhydrase/SulP family sulfate permease